MVLTMQPLFLLCLLQGFHWLTRPSVARGTSEAINGMVGAARKKREDRIFRKSLEESMDEGTSLSAGVSKKKRGRVLDFPLENNSEKN